MSNFNAVCSIFLLDAMRINTISIRDLLNPTVPEILAKMSIFWNMSPIWSPGDSTSHPPIELKFLRVNKDTITQLFPGTPYFFSKNRYFRPTLNCICNYCRRITCFIVRVEVYTGKYILTLHFCFNKWLQDHRCTVLVSKHLHAIYALQKCQANISRRRRRAWTPTEHLFA